jgi:aminoglycoside phosphotransferase (APT) family kinase protein
MAEGSEFLVCLRRDGWVRDRDARLTPLSGGVSSEIYMVQDGDSRFVVKRALPKLKVKDDWFADVSRNSSEWNFIECVGSFLPDAVPQLRFSNPEKGYFGMEYLGDDFANWKKLLLESVIKMEHARMAGRILGEIHRRTAACDDLRQRFDTTRNFHQLRTAPYLLTTGRRHPDFQELFAAEAKRLETTRECLIHGDFSPKNILIRGERMVLLDCEVAWYGDPAFDVAFLLNHLFLKGIYHAPRDLDFANMIGEFWRSYVASRGSVAEGWEPGVTRLLTLLMLARVDGKSPVEYLDSPRAQFVRDFVHNSLLGPRLALATLTADFFEQSRKLSSISVNS